MDYFISAEDRQELFQALIIRFRMGEIGPVTFRADAVKLRIDREDIDSAIRDYSSQCADAMSTREKLPFASGLRRAFN
jgi:hypothetical protein